MQESDDILKHWGIKGMKWKKHKKKGIFSNALNIVKKYEHKTVKGLKKTGDNIKKYEHKTVKSFKKDSNIIKNYTHKTIKNLTKTQKQKDEEALQKYAKKHNLSKKQIEEQRAFLNRMRHPKKLNAESMAKLKTEVKISSPAGLKKHEKKHKKKHNKNDPYMSKADKDLLKELKKRGYKPSKPIKITKEDLKNTKSVSFVTSVNGVTNKAEQKKYDKYIKDLKKKGYKRAW